jgi:hypothetical protein
MVMKLPNAYNRLRVYYILLYIVCLLHVSATLNGCSYTDFHEVACSVESEVQYSTVQYSTVQYLLDTWYNAHYTAVICYFTSVFFNTVFENKYLSVQHCL